MSYPSDNGMLHQDVIGPDVGFSESGNFRVDHPGKDHQFHHWLIPGIDIVEKGDPFVITEPFTPFRLCLGEMLPEVGERIVQYPAVATPRRPRSRFSPGQKIVRRLTLANARLEKLKRNIALGSKAVQNRNLKANYCETLAF